MDHSKASGDLAPRARHPTRFKRPASGVIKYNPMQRQSSDRSSGPAPHSPIAQRRNRQQHIEPSTNVFISYIPPDFDEQDLRNLCSQYGEITRSKIMINLETGESKCFGFVRFKNLEQSAAAIKGIDGMYIRNKKLLAKYAESQEKEEQVTSILFVKRIPIAVNLSTIVELFSQFGLINSVSPQQSNVDVTVPGAENTYWRCYVKYALKQYAKAALSAMNNKIIIPGTMPIHVTYADDSRHSVGCYITPVTPSPTTLDIPSDEQRMLLPSFFFN